MMAQKAGSTLTMKQILLRLSLKGFQTHHMHVIYSFWSKTCC